jgi:uncharacterized membrane protein
MKKPNISKSFWQVLSLGVLAAMRSNAALAASSHLLSSKPSANLASSPLKFMQNEKFAHAFKVSTVGEMIGDKLPNAPDRTASFVITGRCICGGLAGASIYKAAAKKPLIGALLGAAVAFGATYGTLYLRKTLSEKANIKEPFAGLVEDAVVISGAVAFTKL